MLAEKEIEIVPVLEIGNTETIINLLKRGMGISFLPKFTVKEEMKKVPFRDTDGFAGSEDVPSAFVSQEQMDDTTDESVSGSCACTARIS